MKKQKLKMLKIFYEDKKHEEEKMKFLIEHLAQEKEKMLNLHKIKEALNLEYQISSIRDSLLTESEILHQIFEKCNYIDFSKDTNEIYYYLGTFFKENGKPVQHERNGNMGIYDLYIDVESLISIENSKEKRDEFEKENFIIGTDIETPTMEDFLKFRDDFFLDCIKNGENNAKIRLLSKK